MKKLFTGILVLIESMMKLCMSRFSRKKHKVAKPIVSFNTVYVTAILALALVFCQVNNGYCIDEWLKAQPAGTASVSDADTLIQSNNAALDRLVIGSRKGFEVIASSASQVSVLAGEMAIPNAAGTLVKYRRNTATVTVTFSDLDTGSEAAGYYYIYSVGDNATTTATFKLSASSSAPSGITYYKKIGWIYNDASKNIVNVGNIKGGGVPNAVSATGSTDITTTSAIYVDMTDMVVYFVSSGRPVKVNFDASVDMNGFTTIDIDGTDKIVTQMQQCRVGYEKEISTLWIEDLSAGTHTIKVQWKAASGTCTQNGTAAARILTVTEL